MAIEAGASVGLPLPTRCLLGRSRDWLGSPSDPLPLVVFRVGFGLLMAASAIRYLAKGWVETQLLMPEVHFRYLLFPWVGAPPGDWLYAVFGLQILCALLVAAGVWYHAAAMGFFVAFTWVELLDQTTYLNHYYFVSLIALLLIVLPLDRWGRALGRRTGRARSEGTLGEAAPRWIPLALRVQIAFVYLFAGIGKLNPDWLVEAQPLGIWLAARGGLPLIGPLLDQPATAYVMSWAGAAFDLSIAFFLFARRTRPWAYLAVVGFHVTTGFLFPIGVFPWVMIVSTLVFFDRVDIERLSRRVPMIRSRLPAWIKQPVAGPVSGAPARPGPGAITRLVLAGFFAIQVAMPLRHLAYPGPVMWTDEGFRFSWRVMLVEKTGTVIYEVTDPDTGRTWDVFPGSYLTPQQEKQLSFQPDMIQSFAHHLRDRLIAEGIRRPEVRAVAYVSLNGRAGELLIDPTVDLAAAPRTLAPKPWILRHPDL